MKQLEKYISGRLAGRKFCTVYGQDIARIWPMKRKEMEKRDAAIHAFAKANGWTATICDPGIRVTFRKAASGSG